jgi:class 3 adenylate cyclase/CHASE2 domain-containing sensor protein
MAMGWHTAGSARLIRALAVLMIALASIGLHYTDWFGLINGKLLDAGFQTLRTVAPRPVPRDVAVIGIDVEALRAFSEPRDFWHANYGKLLSALAQLRPTAVGLDVVFPERSYQRLIPGLDQALLQGLIAMRGKVPVVLARTVDDFNNFREIFAPYIAIAGTDSVGSVVVCKDDDEVIRRFDEFLCGEDRRESIPSLAGVMAKHLGVERPWRGFIDYRIGDSVPYVPFRQVVQPTEDEKEKVRAALEGRPVLVGFILPFEDRKTVPIDLARWEPGNRSVPGVLVHAQILRSMLNGGLLQSIDVRIVYALCVLGAALALLPSGMRATILFVAFAVALGGMMLYMLDSGRFIEPAAPLLAGTTAVLFRFVDDAIAQARERATLQSAFGGYVSPAVMDEILAGNLSPELGGSRKTVCVMFSDIRGYTKRSEGLSPEQVIQFLNRYFDTVVGLVHANGGCLVSFMGDGFMAVFGAPKPLDNACRAAFEAAVAMLGFVKTLNIQFIAEGTAPIDIGIGLQFGDAVMGHVGSAARHDFTAIGDVTNVASRLETLTKEVGYRVVLSKSVADQLGVTPGLVALGPVSIKGHSAVDVFGYEKT